MPQATERVCDNYTACCKTHAVSEIQKLPGKWCVHCELEKGCAIYSRRPDSCRDFRCEWLKGVGKNSERPDCVKYVLDYAVHKDGSQPGILQIFEVAKGALGRPYVQEITGTMLAQGIWVSHLYLAGRRKLFVPSNQAVTADIKQIMEKEGFEFGVL